MPQSDYLTANSVLFWLVLLIAIGIIFIGVRFIVAPRAAARDFGARVGENENLPYPWAKGTRDIVSGPLTAALLWLKVSPAVLSAFLLVASLIPVGDSLNVYTSVRPKNVSALMIHAGTAATMWLLAFFVLRA